MTSEVLATIEENLGIHATSEDPLNDIHRALENFEQIQVLYNVKNNNSDFS